MSGPEQQALSSRHGVAAPGDGGDAGAVHPVGLTGDGRQRQVGSEGCGAPSRSQDHGFNFKDHVALGVEQTPACVLSLDVGDAGGQAFGARQPGLQHR
ncbi:hypothetical protein D3C81_2098000 [compost metagenome]